MRSELITYGVVACVVCAFYFWTAFTSVTGPGYYGLLTDAFLEGQTHLLVEPLPELLALPDPYEPTLNAPYRLHDASLYDGRYYLYFGPTPALLVHLPLRLAGIRASDNLAAALLACVGFLFALALMRFLLARYRPQTRLAVTASVGLLLGFASVVPFMLRRPDVYEVAIAAGYCCLIAGLYLTLTGALRQKPSLARIAGGSLALGLAVGARPHLIVAIPIWLWAWRHAWRASVGRSGSRRRVVGAAAAPIAGCFVLLAVYNAVRFGSPLELGSSYQLAGLNMGELDRFSLDRVQPGLFSYLLAPPRFDPVFPFAHLDPRYTGVLPDFYTVYIEPVAGLLATTPFVLLAFAAPVALLANRRSSGREGMLLATLFLFAAVLVMAVPIVSFDGATMRYQVDFSTLLVFAALLVGLRLADEVRRPGTRVAAAGLGVAATVVTITLALAFSVTGYQDGLRTAHPRTYQSLESAFAFVPMIAAAQQGHPIVLRIEGIYAPVSASAITVVSDTAGSAVLTGRFTWNSAVPPGGSVLLRVGMPGTEQTATATATPQTFLVTLQRGINIIPVRWTATAAPDVPAGYTITEVSLGPVTRVPRSE